MRNIFTIDLLSVGASYGFVVRIDDSSNDNPFSVILNRATFVGTGEGYLGSIPDVVWVLEVTTTNINYDSAP